MLLDCAACVPTEAKWIGVVWDDDDHACITASTYATRRDAERHAIEALEQMGSIPGSCHAELMSARHDVQPDAILAEWLERHDGDRNHHEEWITSDVVLVTMPGQQVDHEQGPVELIQCRCQWHETSAAVWIAAPAEPDEDLAALLDLAGARWAAKRGAWYVDKRAGRLPGKKAARKAALKAAA